VRDESLLVGHAIVGGNVVLVCVEFVNPDITEARRGSSYQNEDKMKRNCGGSVRSHLSPERA
jgi:hypothetical protein